MRFRNPLLSLVFPIFVTIASCATFVSVAPLVALGDLDELRLQSYPTFSGIASLDVRGNGGGFAGSMALAIDGEKYRVEIYDSVGQTIFAGGGEPEKMIQINPKTGERKEFIGENAAVARFEGVYIPVAFLKSIVYATAPHFDEIISAHEKNGKRIAKTREPEMEIEYSKQIEKIRLLSPEEGEDDGDMVITIGKLTPGPMAPYAKSAHIDWDDGSVLLEIKWEKAKQGIKFPEGFFTFDDLAELGARLNQQKPYEHGDHPSRKNAVPVDLIVAK